jgi:hypothetical protein
MLVKTLALVLVLVACVLDGFAAAPPGLPTLDEVLASKQDLWGLAAMRQPNGPSYEFFAGLLPPLRYVNARFRHYPIVLCAPGSLSKARLASNGSAINALAALNTWKEVGVPVSFYVSEAERPFGEDLNQLDGPRYDRGYLPIVQMGYRQGDFICAQETFASVDPLLAKHAVLLTRFAAQNTKGGVISARIGGKTPLRFIANTIQDDKGQVWLWCDKHWSWDAAKQRLTATLSARSEALLAVATVPMDAAAVPPLAAAVYQAQKKKCAAEWEALLANCTHVEVPEPVVNDAFKSVVCGSFMLLKGDHMNYSAGNSYEQMYEAESGDVVRSLMLWGAKDARRMIPPLLEYGQDSGLQFHDAAFKLQLLAHYYWLTRDAGFVREQKPRWLSAARKLIESRESASGLLPREHYCGDIAVNAYSLNSDANGWRGLRDIAAVLEDIGDPAEAQPIREAAAALRQATLAAVEKSEQRNVMPPFIPIALLGEEPAYDVLTASRLGSYWNLMIPYVLGSDLFPCGSERQTWILRYLQEHGGVCMGMIRFDQHSGLFANVDGVDDIYTMRYVDALLQRDEPERALVSFYGKLAQGMTPGTFIAAEGTGLRPLDQFGRPMYLPPTSSSGAFFLWMYRQMLVQDYDLNHDGRPDTLRLLFATPRRWLEDGKSIRVDNAPTAFGPVSLRVRSRLSRGEVIAEVSLPERNAAKQSLLRIRVPERWRVTSASAGAVRLPVDEQGTADISALRGKQTVRFQVVKR